MLETILLEVRSTNSWLPVQAECAHALMRFNLGEFIEFFERRAKICRINRNCAIHYTENEEEEVDSNMIC